jgi:hypothetical protein
LKKRFLLRLDPMVYGSLHRWADDDLRSVNAQIEYLLRRALKESGRLGRNTDEQGEGSEEAERNTEYPTTEESSD